MKLCPTCQRCYEDDDAECVQGSHEALVAARPGERLVTDKYRLDTLIARGGMGAVYSGTHVDLDRPVAIKLLLPDMNADPSAFERFRREARVAAKIKHSNIADIYDYGSLPDGEAYIVMELVEGQTLLDRIRQMGQLPFAEAVMLSHQIAEGIEAAHHVGIIHRDLKPSNIILTSNFDGSTLVKIIDFGIAKISEQLSADDSTLTATGTLVGTPRYMSPEQCLGYELDARTDIYSFGVILYEMLAGQPPFDATSAVAIALKHVQEQPPPLEQFRPNVPPLLAGLVTDLLSIDPSGRPQTATELKHRLDEVKDLIGEYVTEDQPRVFSSTGVKDEYSTQGAMEAEKPAEASADPYATEVIATELPDAAGIKPVPLFDLGSKTIKRAVPLHTTPISANAVPENGLTSATEDPDETLVRSDRLKDAGVAVPSAYEDPEETLVARKPRRRKSSFVWAGLAIAAIIGALAFWAISRQATPAPSEPVAEIATPESNEAAKPARTAPSPGADALAKTGNESSDQPAADDTADATTAETDVDVGSEQARSEISGVLNEWIAATNAGNVDRQMTFYNPTVDVFYRARNVSRDAVREEKERLFDQADRIEVSAGEPQFNFSEDGQTATTQFRKRYVIEGPEDNRRGEVLQELRWVKTAGGWKITGERDLRVIRNSNRESRRVSSNNSSGNNNSSKMPHQLVLKGVKKLIQPFQ